MEEVEGLEYPKAVYKDGGDTMICGLPITERTVQDAAEEEALLADGWRLQPLTSEHKVPKAPEPETPESLRKRIAALQTENDGLRKQIAAFDPDGNGQIGGGVNEALRAARQRYKDATGKKAFHEWDEAEIDRRIREQGA